MFLWACQGSPYMRRTGCIIRISFRSDLSPKTVMRQLGYSRNEFNLPWSSRPSGAATRRWSSNPSCHSPSGDLEEMGPLQSISLLDILTNRGFGLIQVKEEGWTGFSESNQPKENPVLSDSFTRIYILQGVFLWSPLKFKIVGIFV